MRALSPADPAQIVVLMKGSQVGGTETANNADAYYMHQDPGPILTVVPDLEFARTFSKERLDPMIEATPVLRAIVSEPKERNSGNSLLLKKYRNGIYILAGSRAAARLKSMPIRFLHIEEPDDFEVDVGARKGIQGQGDAISLALVRTETYGDRRKVFMNGTPTIHLVSKIEQWYRRGDQRRYFVPCPACGHMNYITWQGLDPLAPDSGAHHRIRWDEGKPETAHLVCASCEARVEEREKPWMLARGEWRATAESAEGVVSFHLSALYSPLGWKSWSSCARQWRQAKDDPTALRIFANTVLGEPYEDRSANIAHGPLLSRRETYKAEVPNGVGILVSATDVHPDRLELIVKGYGAGEQSWLISRRIFLGDTNRDEVWLEMDRELLRPYVHESGRRLQIHYSTVDTGFRPDRGYRFCKPRAGRRVFAIKGSGETGKPVIIRKSERGLNRTRLYTFCADEARDIVQGRLRIQSPGPGFMHFPVIDWCDEEYFKQLTARRGIWMEKGTRRWREWVKIHERDEAWDLEVYCLVALYIGGRPLIDSLGTLAARLSAPAEAAPAKQAAPRRGPGWMESWKQRR